MELKFELKKTIELTKDELEQIVHLFKTVFEREMDERSLDLAYKSTPLGYSFHSLMKDNGIICGFNSFEPFYYNYHGVKMLFACSVTTMIDKKYRGASNFYYIVSKAYPYLKRHGVSLVYAYPNENSYPVFTKMKLLKDAGDMDTYCLPLKVGAIKPKLSAFNGISWGICKMLISFSKLFTSKKIYRFPIEKELESFNRVRYNKNVENVYKSVTINDSTLYYRVKKHENVKTAFIIDITKKSSRNFVDAVSYLVKTEKDNVELILYPGHLPFKVTGLIKIPRRFTPKRFVLTITLLECGLFEDDIWSIDNWDSNLSNYDLI